jgi:hypothetical protein
MRTLRTALLLLPLVLLGGCLDYGEEVTVERDGSGRLRTEVAVLAELFTPDDLAELRQALEQAKGELERRPDITKVEVEDHADGPKHHFVIDVSARRYQAIADLMNEEGDVLRLEPLDGGRRVRFVRALTGEGAAFAALRHLPTAALAAHVRAVAEHAQARRLSLAASGAASGAHPGEAPEFHVTFKVHAPKIRTSNGDVSGGTATWRWRLEDVEHEAPAQLEAELDLSRSYLPLFALLGAGGAFLFLRKKWQRRWE